MKQTVVIKEPIRNTKYQQELLSVEKLKCYLFFFYKMYLFVRFNVKCFGKSHINHIQLQVIFLPAVTGVKVGHIMELVATGRVVTEFVRVLGTRPAAVDCVGH